MPHSTFPTEFPILYHGTSQNSLIGMIERGIMPRGGTGKDNWQHTVTSNPKTVYLSNCFAHYFAFSAEKEKEGGAALEIDVAKLDRFAFVADEDAVEQSTRGHHIPHTPKWLSQSNDMARRTRWFRDHAHLFDPSVAMRALGTVGYQGVIPWSAVKRVALFTHAQLCHAAIIADPTISTLLFKIKGPWYQQFTRSIFDHDLKADEELSMRPPGLKEQHNIIDVVGEMKPEDRPVIYTGEQLAELHRALQEDAANEPVAEG